MEAYVVHWDDGTKPSRVTAQHVTPMGKPKDSTELYRCSLYHEQLCLFAVIYGISVYLTRLCVMQAGGQKMHWRVRTVMS